MRISPLASLVLTVALSFWGAGDAYALQPPGEGPRQAPGEGPRHSPGEGPRHSPGEGPQGNRDAGPPEGPRPGDGGPHGPPPRRPGEGFGGDFGPPRGPGMHPGGGPPGPGGPHEPGGRPGPDGPPPPTPLEARDETLRSLLQEEAQLRLDCERAAEAARDDQAKVEELRTLVTKHFEIRHDIRARKVELLEQELAALKESLALRQERKQLLVEDRVSELLGKPSPIDF